MLKQLFKRKPEEPPQQHEWIAIDMDSNRSEQMFRCLACERNCYAGGPLSERRYKPGQPMLEEDKDKITMCPVLTWD